MLRRSLRVFLPFAVLGAVITAAPSAAVAAIPSVFTNTTAPVSCAVQPSGATAGQRWCGTATARVPGWETPTPVPIDVSVTFPPASGPDNNWPVIGLFHGWGGSKITPSNAATQRWVNKGYAVFSITARGFWGSCGVLVPTKTLVAGCPKGYIRLMHNAYEVRDAQYLLGKLADQGVIDGQRIGAGGGSYGGAMSIALGGLKDRTQLPDGSMIQWRSPDNNLPMRIAATVPQQTWSDLAQALMPNGSGLDYVANSPYKGPLNNFRFGIQKENWNGSLYGGGLATGYYAPTSGLGFPDPTANLTLWKGLNDTGGPYDGHPLAEEQMNELPNHSAYSLVTVSGTPAPALLTNGWNDDLFPVDESLRYYNRVRSLHPTAAIKMFHVNFGHNPRGGGAAASDLLKLAAAEEAWMDHYVKASVGVPAASQGGVDVITSICPAGTVGAQYTAADWASLAPGEIRLSGAAAQTIVAPGTAPTQAFTTGQICTVTQADGDNASAATYKLDPAPAGGFTIAGSATVIADITTPGANDMIAARLYSGAPGGPQTLIARGLYRPLAVGGGATKQIFQLHPQAWKVAAGDVVKLELLSQDATYARLAPGRNSIQVENLQLRLPTIDAPGSAGGLVTAPLPKYLPPGYTLARDVRTTVPGVPYISSGVNPNATGIFGLGWAASDPATDLVYGLQHRNASGGWSDVAANAPTNSYAFTSGSPEGEGTWNYKVNAHESDGSPATAYSGDSAAIKIDKTAPSAPTASADRAPDYAGDGGWYKDTVDVTFTDNGDPDLADGSAGSGAIGGSLPAPVTHSDSGTYVDSGTVKDAVGNESASTSLTTKVDATAPSVGVTCPAAVLLNASANATVTASDAHSGLVSDPSGTVAIDTSTVGPKTVTRAVSDNVGHDATASCTTQVQYMFGGLLQPVNPDGSSIFKLGSTVPLKFRLTDANAALVPGAIARIDVAKVTGAVEGIYMEAVSTSAATSGNLFRESGGQYIFNLSTKGLTTGTWSLKVTLDDGTSYTTRISLR